MNKSPLIRIVDDEHSTLDAIAFILKCEGYDTVTYCSAKDFLTQDAPSQTGCVILDVRMPEMTGLELFDELRRRGIRLPVIFLTGHGDIEMAVDAMKDGALDFLVKPVDGTKLVDAVGRALMTQRGTTTDAAKLAEYVERWQTLTSREREVIQAVAKGWMNKTIAAELDISIRTVEVHRANAQHKLGLAIPAHLSGMIDVLRKAQVL